jgi:hypothetical protein
MKNYHIRKKNMKLIRAEGVYPAACTGKVHFTGKTGAAKIFHCTGPVLIYRYYKCMRWGRCNSLYYNKLQSPVGPLSETALTNELVPKSVILSPALAVSQAKALRNRIFQGCSSKI